MEREMIYNAVMSANSRKYKTPRKITNSERYFGQKTITFSNLTMQLIIEDSKILIWEYQSYISHLSMKYTLL